MAMTNWLHVLCAFRTEEPQTQRIYGVSSADKERMTHLRLIKLHANRFVKQQRGGKVH